MKKTLSLLALIICLSSVYAQQYNITGQVTDQRNNPVAFANVYIEGTMDGTSSDEEGEFSFTTAEVNGVLKISLIGYTTFSMEGKTEAMQDLHIVLRQSAEELREVTITAGNYLLKTSSTLEAKTAVDLVTTAGSQGDIYNSISLLPGTQVAGTDGRLLVRGGSSRESQTFIDDMHVLSPYTTNTDEAVSRGRFSPFIFEGINFSMGGYSPEYSQSLSSVLPLYTKDENPDSKYGLSLMNVSVGGGGTMAWEKASSSLDLTYTDLDLYNSMFYPKEKDEWNKPYRDFSIKNQTRFDVSNDGVIKLYSSYSNTRFEHLTKEVFEQDSHNVDYYEDNLYLNATFRKEFDRTRFFAGAAWSWNKKDIHNGRIKGDHVVMDDRELHLKTKASHRFSNFYKMEAGLESYYKAYDFFYQDADEFTKLLENNITGLFVSNDFHLSKKWFLNLSGRLEYYSGDNSVAFLPRLALNYQHNSLTVSGVVGKYQQLSDNDYLLYNDRLKPEENFQAMLGVYYQHNDRIYRIEAYNKQYNHLPLLDANNYTSAGTGYSRGVDLFFNDRKLVKNFEYMLAYSYNDSKRKYLDYPVEAVPNYVTRHNASATLKYSNFNIRSIIGLTGRYASGRAYHNPNKPGFMNEETPAYFTLDASWSILVGKKVIVYLSASNILNRNNVYGYRFAAQPDGNGHYAGQPIHQQHNRAFYVGVFITLGKNTAYEASYF